MAGPRSLGQEVIAVDEGPRFFNSRMGRYYNDPSQGIDAHAIVNEYQIGDRLIYAGLFHRLSERTYTIFGPGELPPDGLHKKVTITSGIVTQATFVEPRGDDLTEWDEQYDSAIRDCRRAVGSVGTRQK